MNTNNLRMSIRLLERVIRSLPEESAEADKLAEAVNLILDVLNGDSPDESPVSARRRRTATPLERFRRRYADGI